MGWEYAQAIPCTQPLILPCAVHYPALTLLLMSIKTCSDGVAHLLWHTCCGTNGRPQLCLHLRALTDLFLASGFPSSPISRGWTGRHWVLQSNRMPTRNPAWPAAYDQANDSVRTQSNT